MKRCLDFFLSFILLVTFSSVILITWLLVRMKLDSPAIFKQPRPGINGKVFYVYKFRTMTEERDENGELLPDEVRLTSFGKLLRKLSLDELPQLWNVLKGDMSFVGPRPLLVEYLPLYNERQAKRHDVRPGITGWAQVNGRNAISWEQKFEYDVWYVENRSLRLDFKIMLLTVKKVFVSEGISQDGQATMQKFRGSNGRNSMINFILIGDSGHGKVIEDCIVASNGKVIAKLDDKYTDLFQEGPYLKGPLSSVNELIEENTKVIISIGHNLIRKKIVDRLQLAESMYGTVIHPSAIVSPSTLIKNGTVIMPNVVINAESTIGSHVILNTGSIVEHDCKVGNYAHISPGAVLTGCVIVGEGTQIGAKSSVNPLVNIGQWSIIGAGSAVIKDVPENVTAVGIPTKVIKKEGYLND